MLNPLPSAQWNYENAAHLLNRAGFGGIPEEIEAVRRVGLEQAVAQLLNPPKELEEVGNSDEPWDVAHDLHLRRMEKRRLKKEPNGRSMLREARREERDQIGDLRYWWLRRMRDTHAPLLEKMTLFWHGHFATSAQKVRNAYWMAQQNHTLRRYALENFRTLLKAISRDPAMMVYLDVARSRRGHPNENWAREAMELFTLGIGNYSEEDIRESARAFTGYRLDLRNQEFAYLRFQHDGGEKNFMGRRGNFSGDDILDLIVAHPACPEFIARKLCRFFVEDEPTPGMVHTVADILRGSDFELRPVLRALFTSAEFYSERVRRSQIKSPVQFLVQSCKLLETELPGRRAANVALRQLGQMPLAPPSVKGWDGGKSWITTSTLLFRYNLTNYLINGTEGESDLAPGLERAPLDLSEIIPADLREKPEALIAHLARWFYQASLGEKQMQTFLTYLKTRGGDRSDATMRRLIHLMMSTPQYQLT